MNDFEIPYIHNITESICINKDNNLDLSIGIDQVISHHNKTIIVNSDKRVFGAGKNNGYFCDIPSIIKNEDSDNITEFKPIVTQNKHEVYRDIIATSDRDEIPLVVMYDEHHALAYGPLYFIGFKNGGGWIKDDRSVDMILNQKEILQISSPMFKSIFCSKRCLYYENPLFDMIATLFEDDEEIHEKKHFGIDSMLMTLHKIDNATVDVDEQEHYNIMIRNIFNTSNYGYKSNKIYNRISRLSEKFVANFISYRYMIDKYIKRNPFVPFAKYINLVSMLAATKDYLLLNEQNNSNKTEKAIEYELNDINIEQSKEVIRRIEDYVR